MRGELDSADAVMVAMARNVPRWQRSTTELIYYVCPACCLRLVAELGPKGTEDALPYLWLRYVAHTRSCTPRGPVAWFNDKDWRRSIRVEVVDLFAPLDLSDILSKRALRHRATDLSRSARIPVEKALERVESHIRTTLARQERYSCRVCGRPITKRRAGLDGIGVSCRARD